MKPKKLTIIIISVVLVVAGGYFLMNNPARTYAEIDPEVLDKQVDLYKDPNCGCCGLYAAHLRRAGFKVNVHEDENMMEIKERYGVSRKIQSCHTTVIGDRVIEGHMPLEGIQAFFNQDNIKAISLPGMPNGSPGMPGAKKGAFTVYSFGENMEPMKFMEL